MDMKSLNDEMQKKTKITPMDKQKIAKPKKKKSKVIE